MSSPRGRKWSAITRRRATASSSSMLWSSPTAPRRWPIVGTSRSISRASRRRRREGHRAAKISAVMPRLDRGIRYAAASRSITGVSGILDRPLSRAMTAVNEHSHRKNPPRIEDAMRIQRALERAHGLDLRLGAAEPQVGALEQADAVLGRDRAGEIAGDAVDEFGDLLGAVLRRRVSGIDVQIAVAGMAEHDRIGILVDLLQRLVERVGKRLHLVDGK